MARNPDTGAPVKVKASKKAKITPLKRFKDAVMSASAAPKLAKGVWPPAWKAPAKATPAKTTVAPAAKAAAAKAPATKSPAKRATKASGTPTKVRRPSRRRKHKNAPDAPRSGGRRAFGQDSRSRPSWRSPS